MAQGLPEGFMQTSEHLKGNIESVEHVEVEDIARLWKAVLADDVGRRLEHFFWRLWSSDRLLATVSGNLVAAIFSKISEGGYIRTTPTQSPRSSRSLGVAHPIPETHRHHGPRQGNSPHAAVDMVNKFGNDYDEDEAEQTETEPLSVDRKRLPPRPPPILKKASSTSPSESVKNTHGPTQPVQGSAVTTGREPSSANHLASTANPRLPTAVANALPRVEKTTRFQTDDAIIEDSSRTPKAGSFGDQFKSVPDKGKLNTGRRKPTTSGSTGAARKRPSMRQRSSHSSSSSATLKASFPPDEGIRARTRVESKSNLSSMLKQQISDLENAAGKDTGSRKPAGPMSAGYDPLSKPGGPARSGSKAVPTKPSLTSLPALLKKSSAATAASVSYQASGTMETSQRVQHDSEGDSDRGLAKNGKPPSSRVPPLSEQEAEGSAQPLARSRSQMAMLLQRGNR
ncbi:MAG: hypothetical protein Q9183_001489 [Haloplaca sp. 2 TL-2023]